MTQIRDDYELRIIGPDNVVNLHDLVLYATTIALTSVGVDPRSIVTEESVDRATESVTDSIRELSRDPHV
jgi:hypothetical protein